MTVGLYRLDASLTREELIAELAVMPDLVRSMVTGRGVEELERRTRLDEWSAIQVCKHLRDAAQVYGMRFKWMILNDDPVLPNYDENRWVAESPDGAQDVQRLLHEIAAYRSETVRLLRALSPQGWSRTGRHEVLGSVALEEYVRHQVEHERRHLQQLKASPVHA
jgi:DinB superfamily